jgi:hypothetical protein
MEIHMAIVNGNPILPGDEDWYIPDSEDFMISAQAVVGKDAFVFSTQLEGELHSLADPYSRFYRYEQGKWVCVVVEATITGLALYATEAGRRRASPFWGRKGTSGSSMTASPGNLSVDLESPWITSAVS